MPFGTSETPQIRASKGRARPTAVLPRRPEQGCHWGQRTGWRHSTIFLVNINPTEDHTGSGGLGLYCTQTWWGAGDWLADS